MAKIQFGNLEMAPIPKADIEEMVADGNENIDQINLDPESKTSVSDGTISESGDSTKLERTPILSLTQSDTNVEHVKLIGINKIQLNKRSSPRFMFIAKLRWNNGNESFISRDHDDFFRYHCWILDNFKSQAGLEGKPRAVPYLPGKRWFRNNLELAEQRRPLIEKYLNELITIDEIAQNYQAQAFFGPRPGDPKKDDVMLASFQEQIDNNKDSKLPKDEKEAFYKGTVKGSHDNLTFQHDNDLIEADPKENFPDDDTNAADECLGEEFDNNGNSCYHKTTSNMEQHVIGSHSLDITPL